MILLRTTIAKRVLSILPWLVASVARANTFTVGPGAGADFPNLPAAIAAAEAGDVLLVQPAVYAGGFTLEKGLTIIGYGGARLSGRAVVSHVPAGERATVVDLTVGGLLVDACDGAAIFLKTTSTRAIRVRTSADVRFAELATNVPAVPTATTMIVTDARVEIADSSIAGNNPQSAQDFSGVDGGVGLECGAGSRVHLACSDVIGGSGEDNFLPDDYAGSGGSGIRTQSTSELRIAGAGASLVRAGGFGLNYGHPHDCCMDGVGACAITRLGGRLLYSGVSLSSTPQPTNHPCYCEYLPNPPISNPYRTVAVSPEDPALGVVGAFTPGSTSTLTLRGPVGARAVLALGREIRVVGDLSSGVEDLVVQTRSVVLGPIPTNGSIQYPVKDPSYPPGTFLAAQATITLESGEIRRTNSIPMVFR